jgi:DNA-binding response OmpR family regulator
MTHTQKRDFDKARVLVVDDSRDHADVLANLFGADGFDVQVAYNGELALSVVNEFKPHGSLHLTRTLLVSL